MTSTRSVPRPDSHLRGDSARFERWLPAAALALGSCASVPGRGDVDAGAPQEPATVGRAVQATPRPRRSRPEHDLTVTLQRVEYDELELDDFDVNGTGTPDQDLDDVEQRLTRLRYRIGRQAAGFVIGLVGERVESDQANFEFELAGLELGADGFPRLGDSTPVAGAIDWGVGISLLGGEDDGRFFANEDTDAHGFEFAGRLGGGLDVSGLQISAGMCLSVIGLLLDNDAVDDPFTATAGNSGGYLRVWYRGEHAPVTGGLMLMGGDIRGASVGIGVHL